MRKSWLRRIVATALPPLLLLSSCQRTETKKADPIFAFDTVFEQTVIGGDVLFSVADEQLDADERLFSRTLASAELCRLNEAGEGTVSEETAFLIAEALSLSEASGGAFDPTLAALSDLWDFDGQVIPSEADLSAALEKTGTSRVTAEGTSVYLGGTTLDLGGIAKGYEVGKLLSLYQNGGASGALVSCSSSLGTFGCKEDGTAFVIGIRDPDGDSADLLGLLTLTDCLISTSGDYERCFLQDGIRYHHILDPETGYPVQNGVRSVTVVAPLSENLCRTGAQTDALSTALFVMGVTDGALSLLRSYGMEAVFVTDSGVFVTGGLAECFTLTDSSRSLTTLS